MIPYRNHLFHIDNKIQFNDIEIIQLTYYIKARNSSHCKLSSKNI